MRNEIFLRAIYLLLITISVLATGCASLFGGKEESKPQALVKPEPMVDGQPVVKFSENPQLPVASDRQFKRTTRQKLEEDAELQASAGSMWIMEGQGAYLFSQNKIRREGDILGIKIDGAAQKQIETKVGVIRKLLKQLEEEEKKQKELEEQRRLAENEEVTDAQKAQRKPAAEDKKEDKKEEKEEPVDIGMVPTRVVERTGEGSYRVKGSQPFMIGKREYKVIVTGLIRPEDYNDEGVSSTRMIDAQYDVVSIRRKE